MRKKAYTDAELTHIVESTSNCKFVETYRKKDNYGGKRILKLICGCGDMFEVAWNKFNRKDGMPQQQCRKCGLRLRGESQRITDAEYTRRKEELGINIDHLEEPKGRTVGIRHVCPSCSSTEWFPHPANILSGASTKCSPCAKSAPAYNKKDEEWYKKEKERLGIVVQNVQEFVSSDTPIWHICPECSGGWLVRPGAVLQGASQSCTPCSYKLRGEARILTQEEVRQILQKLSLEWVAGEYAGKDSILTLKCSCGNTFDKRFSDARSGWNRCRKCALSISSGEHRIKEFLEKHSFDFVHQQKFDDLRGKRKMPLSYDFGVYAGGKLIALVEYDGGHHFKPMYTLHETREAAEKQFEAQVKRDKRKNEYAKSIDVELIRLSGMDYKNLDAKLGEPLKTIKQYANTEVSENITRHRNA